MERMKEDWLLKKKMGSEGCEVERKAMNGMDGRCENTVE